MKKLIAALCTAAIATATVCSFTGCDDGNTIYVGTNAYFAPFEYYDGSDIVGVDVDIMNKVSEKLGKKVEFQNTEFEYVIDNVSSGMYDCGAAGITVTEARKEKVDFSDTYFTSVQYVIFNKGTMTADGTSTDGDSVSYVLWESLAGKKVGVQRDTTGDIYVNDEIDSETGTLHGTNATCTPYDNAQLAVDAMKANQIDVVVVDKLPAQYIVSKNSSAYECYALYYDAATATEEEYAICVTKGNTELLNAINEVLKELGTDGVNKLVSKHLGISE